MPKHAFFAVSCVVFGLIWMANNVGLMPMALFNLWPVILVIVGLGGLVLADRDGWGMKGQSKKQVKRVEVKAKAKKK